jgi:hypothetical protein
MNNVTVLHQGPPPKSGAYEPLVNTLAAITEAAAGREMHVVMDRFHLGERVYGPLLRGKDTLGLPLHRQLERVMLSMDSRLVFCNPPQEVSQPLWAARARAGMELITSPTVYAQLHDHYIAALRQSALQVVMYDFTRPDAIQHVKSLLTRPLGTPRNEGPGIGNWHPGRVVLLVGDRVKNTLGQHGSVEWPFVRETGSSPWLTQHLIDHEIPERLLYWVNAFSHDGKPLDPEFVKRLQPRAIITLGDDAKVWAHDNELMANHQRPFNLSHPQFHKRFRHKQAYPLGSLLQEILRV